VWWWFGIAAAASLGGLAAASAVERRMRRLLAVERDRGARDVLAARVEASQLRRHLAPLLDGDLVMQSANGIVNDALRGLEGQGTER